jgi:hypothetical protein
LDDEYNIACIWLCEFPMENHIKSKAGGG